MVAFLALGDVENCKKISHALVEIRNRNLYINLQISMGVWVVFAPIAIYLISRVSQGKAGRL
jgi:hypothetical protein